jgi:GGDEF domain-containing protein
MVANAAPLVIEDARVDPVLGANPAINELERRELVRRLAIESLTDALTGRPTALVGCDTRTALDVDERLRRAMPDRLTASAGVAAWTSPLSAEAVVAEADRALYRAKRDGRDRACLSPGQARGPGAGSLPAVAGARAAAE